MPQDESINLIRLCRKLTATFTVKQLLEVCSELGVDGELVRLKWRTVKIEDAVALVAMLDSQGRVGDFLNACHRQYNNFSSEGLEIPKAEWLPKPLPDHIVHMLDSAFDFSGKPYITYTIPDFSNQWMPQAVSTGCYDWRINVDALEEILSSTPAIKDALMKVRALIAHERAFAYVASERQWTDSGMNFFPCVVVAPTTDQFDSIRIEQTSDCKGDIEPVGLIEELKSIDEQYGLGSSCPRNG